MIRILRDTTSKNAEQDWLKTNLARFTRMLQGERDSVTVSNMILSEIAPLVKRPARRSLHRRERGRRADARSGASYALPSARTCPTGSGCARAWSGRCAYERKRILLTQVPVDYITIGSALGEADPLNIIVLPCSSRRRSRR
jgi:hypothetical protein